MQVNYPDMALAFLLMNQLDGGRAGGSNCPARYGVGEIFARPHRARARSSGRCAWQRCARILKSERALSKWLIYAIALRAAGRSDEAHWRIEAAVEGAFPASATRRRCSVVCCSNAKIRRAPAGSPRRFSNAARRRRRTPPDVRCALLAAAATRDVAARCGDVDSDRSRRTAPSTLGHGDHREWVARLLLSPHSYPWSKVAGDPAVSGRATAARRGVCA